MTTVFRNSYFRKHLLPEFTRCVYCNNHYATYYFKLHQYPHPGFMWWKRIAFKPIVRLKFFRLVILVEAFWLMWCLFTETLSDVIVWCEGFDLSEAKKILTIPNIDHCILLIYFGLTVSVVYWPWHQTVVLIVFIMQTYEAKYLKIYQRKLSKTNFVW